MDNSFLNSGQSLSEIWMENALDSGNPNAVIDASGCALGENLNSKDSILLNFIKSFLDLVDKNYDDISDLELDIIMDNFRKVGLVVLKEDIKNVLLYAKLSGFTKKSFLKKFKVWSSKISDLESMDPDFLKQLFSLFGHIGFENLLQFSDLKGKLSEEMFNDLKTKIAKDDGYQSFSRKLGDLFCSFRSPDPNAQYSPEIKIIFRLRDSWVNIIKYKSKPHTETSDLVGPLFMSPINYERDDFSFLDLLCFPYESLSSSVTSSDIHGLLECMDFNIRLDEFSSDEFSLKEFSNIEDYAMYSGFTKEDFFKNLNNWLVRINSICSMDPEFLEQLYDLFGHIDSEDLLKFSDIKSKLSDDIYSRLKAANEEGYLSKSLGDLYFPMITSVPGGDYTEEQKIIIRLRDYNAALLKKCDENEFLEPRSR